jgi:hypothetical protein
MSNMTDRADAQGFAEMKDTWLLQVARDATLKRNAVKVAIYIAIRLNSKSREAFPSPETIAKDIGLSRATVFKMLGQLETAGHLEIVHGTRVRPTRYRVIIAGETDHRRVSHAETRDQRRVLHAKTRHDATSLNFEHDESQLLRLHITSEEPKKESESESVDRFDTKRANQDTAPSIDAPSTKCPSIEAPSTKTTSPKKSEPKPKPTRAEHGTRIAEDWKPTLDGIAFARLKGLSAPDIENEIGKFHDHWLAANGPSATKRSWPAAWRLWIRNAIQFRERDAARDRARMNGYARKPTAAERDADILWAINDACGRPN